MQKLEHYDQSGKMRANDYIDDGRGDNRDSAQLTPRRARHAGR